MIEVAIVTDLPLKQQFFFHPDGLWSFWLSVSFSPHPIYTVY